MLHNTILPTHEEDKLKAIDIATSSPIQNQFPIIPQLRDVVELDELQKRLTNNEIDTQYQNKLSKMLDEMAKMFNVEYWREEWSLRRKLNFLEQFRKIKRYAGTKYAIQTILNIFANEHNVSKANIIELYEKEPGNIIINIPNAFDYTKNDTDDLRRLIDIYKPVHVGYALRRSLVNNHINIGLLSIVIARKYKHFKADIENIKLMGEYTLLALPIVRKFVFMDTNVE